jgi:hypothetical protein
MLSTNSTTRQSALTINSTNYTLNSVEKQRTALTGDLYKPKHCTKARRSTLALIHATTIATTAYN